MDDNISIEFIDTNCVDYVLSEPGPSVIKIKEELDITDSIAEENITNNFNYLDDKLENKEVPTSAKLKRKSINKSNKVYKPNKTLPLQITINVDQINLMVVYMCNHPQFAKSMEHPNENYRAPAAVRLWRELMEILNSIGPPIRQISGWKSAWTTFTNNIKHKINANRVNKDKSNFVPIPYTENQKKIIHLLKLETDEDSDRVQNKSDDLIPITPITFSPGDDLPSTFDMHIGKIFLEHQQQNKNSENEPKKLELFERYINAIEATNKLNKEYLEIKKQSANLKQKTYELMEKKYQIDIKTNKK